MAARATSRNAPTAMPRRSPFSEQCRERIQAALRERAHRSMRWQEDRQHPLRKEQERCAIASSTAMHGECANRRQPGKDQRQRITSEEEIAEGP